VTPVDLRAAAILGWCAVLITLALAVSDRLGLKYVQEIIWPTDLYAFQHIQTGPIDVAILGSSRTTFGLAPTALDPCLSRAVGRPVRSYNLARVFASMQTERIMARDLLVDERIPRIAVVEVAPEILSARHHEHTYNTATQAGLPEVPGCLRDARSGDDLVACARAPLRGVENIAWLLSGQYRDVDHLSWMMVHQRGGQFCYGSPECQEHNRIYADRLNRRWFFRMENVIPTLTADRFTGWRLGGAAGQAMDDLIAEASTRGYRLVFLNMPVHGVYQERVPPEDYAEFLAYMQRISAESGAVFLDANTSEWQGARERFHDPDHLSASGTERLSGELCEALAPLLREP
jgi:hypothetical protein